MLPTSSQIDPRRPTGLRVIAELFGKVTTTVPVPPTSFVPGLMMAMHDWWSRPFPSATLNARDVGGARLSAAPGPRSCLLGRDDLRLGLGSTILLLHLVEQHTGQVLVLHGAGVAIWIISDQVGIGRPLLPQSARTARCAVLCHTQVCQGRSRAAAS